MAPSDGGGPSSSLGIPTKTCFTCKVEKPLAAFPVCSKNTDGLLGKCRDCKRVYDNEHYKKHSVRLGPVKTKRARLMRRRNSEWIAEYLSAHPCVDCTESDIIVLDFDHLRDKSYNISDLVKGGASIHLIKKEIEKCEVRCANCHRRVTWQRRQAQPI